MAILDEVKGTIGAAQRLLGRASAIVVAIVALVSFDVAPAAPVTETNQLITDPEQKLSVEVSGWLGLGKVAEGCSEGLVPLRFTVVNGGDTEATITVRFAPGYGTIATVPWARIVAAPGATVRSTVYVGSGQVGTSPGPAYFPSWVLSFGASGSGPRRDVVCQIHQNWSSVTTTATSSSPSPGGFHNPELQDNERRLVTAAAWKRIFEARHRSFNVAANSEVDPAIAPEDWRGWTTLREFVLTDDDWTAMPTASRRAMLEWIALGGHVVLLAADTDRDRLDRIGLPASQADGRRRVGAGEVIPLANDAIPPGTTADTGFGDALVERPVGWADSPWSGIGLGRQAGFLERGLPVAAILTFLALLAIIAGPVNIMLLAGRGRPARIFWTTPVISLVATSLLLGLMFFRDGVGGAGARRTLCLLDPDRNTMAILQEQFSRTGILLGGSFPIREPSWMQPQPLTTTPYNVPTVTGSFVEIEDQRRSGDWFTSRSDQAFTLQTVRPGRGRIELAGPADSPEILSSLDVPLERVFVIDEEGRWWKTGRLGAGERRPLETSSAEEFAPVSRDLSYLASKPIVRAIARLEGLPGYAWAEAAEPGKVAIASLDAIRWSQDDAWFVGPVVRTEDR